MCVAAAAVPWIISAVGVAASTYVAVKSANQAADAQQAQDDKNAKIADTAAQNANAEGTYQADQARIRGNLMRGQQQAAFAANNVDSTTGSAADILGDTAMFTSQDETQARTNAAMRSYGFQVQSNNDTLAGKYAQQVGSNQATASLINGANQGAGVYNKGKLAGAWG